MLVAAAIAVALVLLAKGSTGAGPAAPEAVAPAAPSLAGFTFYDGGSTVPADNPPPVAPATDPWRSDVAAACDSVASAATMLADALSGARGAAATHAAALAELARLATVVRVAAATETRAQLRVRAGFLRSPVSAGSVVVVQLGARSHVAALDAALEALRAACLETTPAAPAPPRAPAASAPFRFAPGAFT